LKQDGYYIKNICHNLMNLSTMHSLGTTQSYLHAQICNDSHFFFNSNECLKLNMIIFLKIVFIKTFFKKGAKNIWSTLLVLWFLVWWFLVGQPNDTYGPITIKIVANGRNFLI